MTLSAAETAQMLVEQAKRALWRHAQGDRAGAEADYRAVIGQVQHIGLYVGFGTLLLQTNRAAEGGPWLRRALALDPARVDALEHLGVLLNRLGRADAAVAWLRRRLRAGGESPGALANLGVALTAAGKPADAAVCLRAAIRLQPGQPDHRFNLAGALERTGDRAEALSVHRQALCLDPAHSGSLENGGLCAALLGLATEALALHERKAALSPGDEAARFWCGDLRLAVGDWREGWADWEARRAVPGFVPDLRRYAGLPRWDGRPMPDGTLALVGEQGMGDALIFCRFLPLVAARVKRVLLLLHRPLVPLLRGRFDGVEVLPFDASEPADAALPLMSLGAVLGMTPDRLPRDSYVSASPNRVAAWKAELGAGGDRRFGLVWAGNPDYRHDRLRSPGLTAIRPLLDIAGWRAVILQVGPGRAGVDAAALPPTVFDVGARLHDFADTAAAVAALDLVITSVTSVAHLAGAMGKETWLMTPLMVDWRWVTASDGRQLWYPAMRLFRQTVLGRWDDVVDRIGAALTRSPHDGV